MLYTAPPGPGPAAISTVTSMMAIAGSLPSQTRSAFFLRPLGTHAAMPRTGRPARLARCAGVSPIALVRTITTHKWHAGPDRDSVLYQTPLSITALRLPPDPH